MSRKHFCPTCGQSIQERPIRLDKLLVQILAYIRSFYPDAMPSKALRSAFPGGVQYSVVSKLKYFDLAYSPARNWWKVTPLGMWFLDDWEDATAKVWVFDDTVIRREGTISVTAVQYIEVNHDTIAQEWQPHYLDPTEGLEDEEEE